MMALENIHIGPVDEEPDWRDQPDESPDDDEEEETDPSVIAILGFDPVKEETEEDPLSSVAFSSMGILRTLSLK